MDADVALAQRTATCWACGDLATLAPEFGNLSLYECRSCGLGFTPERLIDVAQLYDADYFDTYDDGRPYAGDESERRLEAAARLRFVRRYARGGQLLEIGAAAGYFVAAASRVGFGAVGIEPNAEMARIGRERLDADVRAGRAEEAAALFRDVDVVCAWHVLEHLQQPRATLERLRGAMAADGLIFVEVPNFGSVRARRDRENWRYLHPEHHLSQFTPEALRALLDSTGFTPLEVVSIPWAEYKRWPRSLLSYGKQALVVGGSTFLPHPWKHELLRAVAQRRSFGNG